MMGVVVEPLSYFEEVFLKYGKTKPAVQPNFLKHLSDTPISSSVN